MKPNTFLQSTMAGLLIICLMGFSHNGFSQKAKTEKKEVKTEKKEVKTEKKTVKADKKAVKADKKATK